MQQRALPWKSKGRVLEGGIVSLACRRLAVIGFEKALPRLLAKSERVIMAPSTCDGHRLHNS